MKKQIVNNACQPGKKIFIGGKVYDLSAMDKCTVESSVQAYLDGTVGKDKVRFELYTIGNTVAMFSTVALTTRLIMPTGISI